MYYQKIWFRLNDPSNEYFNNFINILTLLSSKYLTSSYHLFFDNSNENKAEDTHIDKEDSLYLFMHWAARINIYLYALFISK